MDNRERAAQKVPAIWAREFCTKHDDYDPSCDVCIEEVVTSRTQKAYLAGWEARAAIEGGAEPIYGTVLFGEYRIRRDGPNSPPYLAKQENSMNYQLCIYVPEHFHTGDKVRVRVEMLSGERVLEAPPRDDKDAHISAVGRGKLDAMDLQAATCADEASQTRPAPMSIPVAARAEAPLAGAGHEPVELLIDALEGIAAGHDCACDHDDENCCERVEEYCPKCIAEVALAKWKDRAAQKEPQP